VRFAKARPIAVRGQMVHADRDAAGEPVVAELGHMDRQGTRFLTPQSIGKVLSSVEVQCAGLSYA
jgi:hypothetical protein